MKSLKALAQDQRHLARTIDRKPRKDAASLEATPDLVHPIGVKHHPLGLLTDYFRRFSSLPQIICGKLSDTTDRDLAPTCAKCVAPKTESRAEYGTSERGNAISSVAVVAQPEEDG